MQRNDDNSSQGLVALGVVLVVIGVAVGIWALTLLHTLLYDPGSVPLVEQVLLDLDDNEEILAINERQDGVSFNASSGMRRLVLGILALTLFITLGSIISAFISGGAKVIRVGRPARAGDR